MALLSVPACDRPGLFQSLSRHIDRARTQRCHIGLVLLDIKNFTSVNRVHNFKYGDRVLHSLSERLRENTPAPDCLFRLGSDEFALIVPELGNSSEIVVQANYVLDQMRQPFFWRDEEIHVDVNVGCIALNAERAGVEQLLSSAEHLLQQAKMEGRPLCYATEAQHENEDFVWQLEQELIHALHNNELQMVYQPKIDLRTGDPCHAEALLRWHHPTKGSIAPSYLVAMITRLSREFELTKWALHTALRKVGSWPDLWGGNGVAVNIPANIVHHPDFRRLVEDSLQLWKVRPDQLTLEITENAVLEDQQAGYSNLEYLKSRGIRISIDDFGTGYSSLQYFKSIPATELKIDQSFVLNMAANAGDRNIAQLIIELAHRFGLKVVAEGVEHLEVLQELKRLGCDFAQGYYIAHPLPSGVYGRWLEDYQPGAVI